MSYKNRLLFCSLILICLIGATSLFAPDTSVTSRADWTYPSGFDPHGGHIDRLTMVVYPSNATSRALQDLEANNIYAYDDNVPLSSIDELVMQSNIEVNTEQGTGLLLFSFRNWFPANISGYRRALAYALDKYVVCERSTDGYALPIDGVIPLANSTYSYESQITEYFYSKEIVKANASLEACGFRDLDGDGWREYDANNNSLWDADIDVDDGSWAHDFLWLPIYVWLGDDPAFHAAEILVEGMAECGLHGAVIEWDPYTYTEWPPEKAWCSMWNGPISEEPNFLYLLHTGSYTSQYLDYSNPEYDVNVTLMYGASTKLEVRDWAWNCSQILLQDMPIIPCYNDVITQAYWTDLWEGYVNMLGVNRLGNNPWTFTHLRLKDEAGGPFGPYPTEYLCALTEGMDSTNIRVSSSRYADRVFMNVYSRLWQMDPLTWEEVPDLAYDWMIEPTEPSGDIRLGQKFTFHLYENVTWHDGTLFTAQDVAFSFNHIWKGMSSWEGGFYTTDPVDNIYRIDTPDDYTVVIYTNQTGYLEFYKGTHHYILPKHIWEQHLWNGTDSLMDWEPSTPQDLVGTGPFRWVNRVPGSYIVLDRHYNWHFTVDQSLRTPMIPWTLYIFISLGIIIVLIQIGILGYLLNKRRASKTKHQYNQKKGDA
ncbi:MAG: ABC transporter substrate-binding protein [Candidatus Hermodarchaeota archaeon]|nr:ABC transporter substrate-binding protein [Candidatus Hermodarchaeota archaeon]